MLEARFYIDEALILDACRAIASFNRIYEKNAIKLDIFIQKNSRGILSKRVQGDKGRIYNLSSPQDTIRCKLEWYKAGGGEWARRLDVLQVLKVQSNALDYSYLSQRADRLHLSELLEQAFRDAGLRDGHCLA